MPEIHVCMEVQRGSVPPHLPDAERAWLTLAMSTTLAGNLTVLGSVANLIVIERARREERRAKKQSEKCETK